MLPVMVFAAGEPIAPDGITYVEGSDEANALAINELKAAFSGKQIDIADLVKKGIDKNGKVFLGVYLSQVLAKGPKYVEGSFAGGEYQIPLSKKDNIVIHAKLLALNKDEQLQIFTDLFGNTYLPSQPITIRKLTKDEMALIWFYISWDLVEPIYVVESGNRKLVFEFDPSGTSLQWIEDLSEPCFKLAFGDSGLPCMCHVIDKEGNRYHTAFKPMSECTGVKGSN